MLSAFRTSLAAAAIAAIGLAGAAASAKPVNVPLGPNKLILKLCKPHVETHHKYLGIRKIGFKYYRVYLVYGVYVNKLCHKKVIWRKIKYVPLPWFFKKSPAGV